MPCSDNDGTSVGTVRLSVWPKPSCPCTPTPHAYTAPSATTSVCLYEHAAAVTRFPSSGPNTRVRVPTWSVWPNPSCPLELQPVMYKWPSAVTTPNCSQPLDATRVATRMPGANTGWLGARYRLGQPDRGVVASTRPHCPLLFNPAVYTVPSAHSTADSSLPATTDTGVLPSKNALCSAPTCSSVLFSMSSPCVFWPMTHTRGGRCGRNACGGGKPGTGAARVSLNLAAAAAAAAPVTMQACSVTATGREHRMARCMSSAEGNCRKKLGNTRLPSMAMAPDASFALGFINNSCPSGASGAAGGCRCTITSSCGSPVGHGVEMDTPMSASPSHALDTMPTEKEAVAVSAPAPAPAPALEAAE